MVTAVFTVSGDLEAFNERAFRTSLLELFPEAEDVRLIATAGSVRVEAKLVLPSISAATTTLNTLQQTTESALTESLGVVVEALDKSSLTMQIEEVLDYVAPVEAGGDAMMIPVIILVVLFVIAIGGYSLYAFIKRRKQQKIAKARQLARAESRRRGGGGGGSFNSGGGSFNRKHEHPGVVVASNIGLVEGVEVTVTPPSEAALREHLRHQRYAEREARARAKAALVISSCSAQLSFSDACSCQGEIADLRKPSVGAGQLSISTSRSEEEQEEERRKPGKRSTWERRALSSVCARHEGDITNHRPPNSKVKLEDKQPWQRTRSEQQPVDGEEDAGGGEDGGGGGGSPAESWRERDGWDPATQPIRKEGGGLVSRSSTIVNEAAAAARAQDLSSCGEGGAGEESGDGGPLVRTFSCASSVPPVRNLSLNSEKSIEFFEKLRKDQEKEEGRRQKGGGSGGGGGEKHAGGWVGAGGAERSSPHKDDSTQHTHKSAASHGGHNSHHSSSSKQQQSGRRGGSHRTAEARTRRSTYRSDRTSPSPERPPRGHSSPGGSSGDRKRGGGERRRSVATSSPTRHERDRSPAVGRRGSATYHGGDRSRERTPQSRRPPTESQRREDTVQDGERGATRERAGRERGDRSRDRTPQSRRPPPSSSSASPNPSPSGRRSSGTTTASSPSPQHGQHRSPHAGGTRRGSSHTAAPAPPEAPWSDLEVGFGGERV